MWRLDKQSIANVMMEEIIACVATQQGLPHLRYTQQCSTCTGWSLLFSNPLAQSMLLVQSWGPCHRFLPWLSYLHPYSYLPLPFMYLCHCSLPFNLIPPKPSKAQESHPCTFPLHLMQPQQVSLGFLLPALEAATADEEWLWPAVALPVVTQALGLLRTGLFILECSCWNACFS